MSQTSFRFIKTLWLLPLLLLGPPEALAQIVFLNSTPLGMSKDQKLEAPPLPRAGSGAVYTCQVGGIKLHVGYAAAAVKEGRGVMRDIFNGVPVPSLHLKSPWQAYALKTWDVRILDGIVDPTEIVFGKAPEDNKINVSESYEWVTRSKLRGLLFTYQLRTLATAHEMTFTGFGKKQIHIFELMRLEHSTGVIGRHLAYANSENFFPYRIYINDDNKKTTACELESFNK